ncbi:BadF/BadG/BcrA/BcrD ATPase family protein [Conexibacter sp. JD483]|uniref:BadF/BadG/BcrA/BcrD ATPase family protein n=1 Tax=unclassified Conexibacter TaxID=2627773 RepID=UPI00271B2627|nr:MULTISPECIES: BadF/BadG/BcrA/BcrD ATPase family protein [unclassified Conexibacter]MDO8188009.1 BadF/BadG/BcrA/BcrD ATPase family protein [Conexibacter sp. CPCC 205706]MDO8200892.1 BadF/BadG/BcrA/BcrD ATPase family protein [Conexibacter sp. CPCC 205762]MDR9370375.1 BadF/BadG/BcrA/BcrD ATPase family protein [Conexibacter sp. JD483]
MIVALDAGQSSTRVLLDGRPATAPSRGVRRMEEGVGPADVLDDLLAALPSAAHATNGSHRPTPCTLDNVAVVAVGLSGFELAGEEDLRAIAAGLRAATGAGRVAIATDGVTSLLGALGREPGVAVAVGTGVVVLGHDGAGRWARVDGWGATLGDDGSGFAIGAAGLRAALRAFDGRAGGSQRLLEAVVERFGAAEEMPLAVHRGGPAAPVAAAFVPIVGAAAADGCEVAREILAHAGEELAISATAACERALPGEEPVTVAQVGGVWSLGPALVDPFADALARRCPRARVTAPAGTSLDGAHQLAAATPRLEPVAGLLWWDG